MAGILAKIFGGNKSEKDVKKISPHVEKINEFFRSYQSLSNDELRNKTQEFRRRIKEHLSKIDAQIEAKNREAETLPFNDLLGKDAIYQEVDKLKKDRDKEIEKVLMNLLPEAFAVVKETARRFKENAELESTATQLDRDLSVKKDYVTIHGDKSIFKNTWTAAGGQITWNMLHYDVQLIGGIVLHEGKIAEMATGEGKTLVATLPVYLNALSGKGVHLVTVNDYLARRDSAWMGKLYNWLGLSVGVVYPGMPHQDKHAAYAADITYGTNNEFGFDYLRDNMALAKEARVQRKLNYAIVDEVDSILIDEARTPLIISGPADESPELYIKVNRIVPSLVRQKEEEGEGDYWVDEKQKQVHLSEEGQEHAEELLRKAGIYQRDVDYIVRDGEVVIVDEFTGRTLPGRRWSDGLHQAVEAKEGVPVQPENQTLASITFQNLFRMYKKLAGMTGTADTEAYEFESIYGLEVVVIPTHRPMVRKDHSDLVFLNRNGKYRAVLNEIKEAHARKQPVLVGTTSIEVSEMLSDQLREAGIPHEGLNAKQHEREAHIVAEA